MMFRHYLLAQCDKKWLHGLIVRHICGKFSDLCAQYHKYHKYIWKWGILGYCELMRSLNTCLYNIMVFLIFKDHLVIDCFVFRFSQEKVDGFFPEIIWLFLTPCISNPFSLSKIVNTRWNRNQKLYILSKEMYYWIIKLQIVSITWITLDSYSYWC